MCDGLVFHVTVGGQVKLQLLTSMVCRIQSLEIAWPKKEPKASQICSPIAASIFKDLAF